jgi:hypothetical protein
MAISLRDESGYFITGYNGGLNTGTTTIEFIKTGINYLNKCYRSQYALSHNPRNIIPVDCEVNPAYPDFVEFTLTANPYNFYYEISCPNSTGIGQIDEPAIEANPNPAKDRLFISIPDQGNVYYSIFDAKGIKTGEGKLDNGISEIDVSAQRPGLYIVKLLVDNKCIIRKVIIE